MWVVATGKRVTDVARVGCVSSAAFIRLTLAGLAYPTDWAFAPPLQLGGSTCASVGARIRLAYLIVDVDFTG